MKVQLTLMTEVMDSLASCNCKRTSFSWLLFLGSFAQTSFRLVELLELTPCMSRRERSRHVNTTCGGKQLTTFIWLENLSNLVEMKVQY